MPPMILVITGRKLSEISNELGSKKYESLSYVAKVSLTLAHSKVIPERGFSINNSMLGKDHCIMVSFA